MTCLKNYIQVEGCAAPEYTYTVDGQAAAPSGLYINRHLPITLRSIDKTANEEQVTFLGVWDEVQDRGIVKFALRVKHGHQELFSHCVDDAWVCTNREKLAMALLYFLGGELMQERLYSERINRYTTIDRDKAELMRADFEQEFTLHLKAALHSINAGQHQQLGAVMYYQEALP